jgi:hypothetical protein
MKDETTEENATIDKILHDMELNNLCAWPNIIMSDSTDNYG